MNQFNQFLTSLNLNPAACGAIMPSKRSACDECREDPALVGLPFTNCSNAGTRKLACSKDLDGCERCKRENISCHYSEQKPMGRPRKRQFIETTRDDPAASSQKFDPLDLVPLSYNVEHFDIYNDNAPAEPYFTNGQSALTLPPEETVPERVSKVDGQRVMWHFGDQNFMGGPPINFENMDLGRAEDPVPTLNSPPKLSTPSLTDSENSHSVILAPCSCLASMYLALSSLQQFPSDIVAALRTVRGAAATAAETIVSTFSIIQSYRISRAASKVSCLILLSRGTEPDRDLLCQCEHPNSQDTRVDVFVQHFTRNSLADFMLTRGSIVVSTVWFRGFGES
jgi:hypothetical protein